MQQRHHRPLGNSGMQVAPIAFGGNVFGWTADEATSFRLLDAFVDSGFNLVDTADVYSRWAPGHSGGESEAIIGRWLRQGGKRDKIVLATKVGMEMGVPASPHAGAQAGAPADRPAGAHPGAHAGGQASGRMGLSRRWIRQAVHDSLSRLQTDHIDLYQAHKDDTDTPLEETLSAFAELVQEGKVRAIGASNYSAARLAEALAVSARLGLPRYETLQPHYNLVERAGYEDALEPLCRSEGLGVINFFGLARGFLTGKYRSDADLAQSPRGFRYAFTPAPRGLGILAALDAVAASHRATPAQVALAWQIARPGITAPIASATSVAQWQELAGAAALQLHAEDIAELSAASAPDRTV
jgi:aryl-alcohol dehydrogenase-like predicted oxidoreductase